MDATAVIPTIPPREDKLSRALRSVGWQTHTVRSVSLAVDHDHEGAAATRNRALRAARTDWVAFLDDDDEWLPQHVETLVRAARASKADVVYPWFVVQSRRAFDPWPGTFRQPFDPERLRTQNYIPTTVLARRDAVLDVGGFEPYGAQEDSACDDWGLWRKLVREGARFHHTPHQTWIWHWHGKHTSGLGSRW